MTAARRVLLEQVFKTNGVPTHTFVEPREWPRLMVALRTPGRGVVIEGPSGIGKTSAVQTALVALEMKGATKLSARVPDDVEYIAELPNMPKAGVVLIDDFHKLDYALKKSIADYLKTLADSEGADTKVIIVGINNAGEELISLASDLNNRIDVLRFETNSTHKVKQVVELGERALNITINVKDELAEAAHGSFYLAQMLCHDICLRTGVTEERDDSFCLSESFESVKADVLERLRAYPRTPAVRSATMAN